MAKQIRTEILINATPQTVWQVLTNFSRYPEWNPFIKKIEGEVAVGSKIKVRLEPPGASGMTFVPTVQVFEAGQKFQWLGHLLFPGLFDGKHIFELIDHQNGTTTLVHREEFSGILVPLFQKMLDNNTLDGFRQMNEQLKILAEKH